MTKKEVKKILKDYKDFLNKEIPIYTKISDYSINKYIKEQLTLTDVVKHSTLFANKQCGYNKIAVNTTLKKICCAKCRSFAN